jgi:L-threonylcarbamoyladenylate synthase
MPARIVPVSDATLREAVARLRGGRLVAFPTETVYGLGAHALDPEAVARIYAAKGRPARNPVIVHIPTIDDAKALATNWTDAAMRLATRFWPGPLTLVVEKAPCVPDIVSAGGATVGLRVPDHPVAAELLRRAGVPVAAPSANRSEEVSPTTAQHVADSLGAFVDDLLILDGGPCRVGIESAVVDATVEPPRVLRPGTLLADALGAVLAETAPTGDVLRAPGQLARHYAPRKRVLLVEPGDTTATLRLGDDPERFAAGLYAALRMLDADPAVTSIRVERPPQTAAWTAVRDRLLRAATP